MKRKIGKITKGINGRHTIQTENGGQVLSRYNAEQAMGKKLAGKHPVHHANGDCSDDTNSNLVVCEDAAYHALLHKRMRELNIRSLLPYQIKLNVAKLKRKVERKIPLSREKLILLREERNLKDRLGWLKANLKNKEKS